MTLLMFNGFGFPLRRVLANSAVAGVGSLVLFAMSLDGLDLSLDQYLSTWGVVQNVGDPVISRLLFTLLEAGLLYAVVPLSLLVRERRQAMFMLTWFLLSTLPFPFLLTHIEARFLLANLIPLTGLTVLSIDSLRVGSWWRRPLGGAAVAVGLFALVITSTLAQRIMAHEVEPAAVRRVIADLDRDFGPGNYRIVVPWLYSDFHYLRVARPDLDVYTVFTPNTPELSVRWQKLQYGARSVACLEELRQLREPVVYLGFIESMPVANLRQMIDAIPVKGLKQWVDSKIAQSSSESHYQASWMYGDPNIRLIPAGRQSHYRWARVMVLPRRTFAEPASR